MVATCIAKMLVEAGFPNTFPCLVGADAAPEPIVVTQGPFKRWGLAADGERGVVPVTLAVVRETSADAESVAWAASDALLVRDWEPHAGAGPLRICGIHPGAPCPRGRDGSGRWVWEVEVDVTVVRRGA